MTDVQAILKRKILERGGMNPVREGSRQFALYGGVELPFLEYRLDAARALLRVALEGADTVWLILYMDEGGIYASELDASGTLDEAATIVRAAAQGTVVRSASLFRQCVGLRIRGSGIDWYMEPFTGETLT